MNEIVLSLCDRTGVMVQPWLAAGYPCWIVDLQHPPGLTIEGQLVRIGCDLLRNPDRRIIRMVEAGAAAIVFAFPVCQKLANSGNRWKVERHGLEGLYEALGLVIACKRICEASKAPWMIENPVGSLSTYWREPDFTFQPWEYTTPKEKKRTCIWAGNNFVIPQREVFDEPADVQESIWRMPPASDRSDRRSVTPDGWARAVFQANEPWIRKVESVGA